MQELDKFNLIINVIPTDWKIYISFNINNNLIFVDTFQFLSSLLDRVVKSLSKDDFKYFSQEFDKNVLDLVKQKGFYPCDYVNDFG